MKEDKAKEAWEIMDGFAQTTEYLAGFKNQLIAQGFSEEHAGELVILTFKQALIEQWKSLDMPNEGNNTLM